MPARDGQDDDEQSTSRAGEVPVLDVAAVDAALGSWWQGDVIDTEAVPFVVLAATATPLTDASREAAADDPGDDPVLEVFTDERGLVIVSQTCDVVRCCGDRPFIEVAPVVELEADDYREAERGRTLRYAVIPGLATERRVADLDRVMTVEKALLAGHAERRTPGCTTDEERRRFASTLARRRGRFAFDDDFSAALAKMVEHVLAKHGRESPLGRFLLTLADIRAQCPDWNAEEPDVALLFVFPTLADVPGDAAKHIDTLVERFRPTGRFTSIRGRATNLETMSAAAYLASDALELEHVSRGRRAQGASR